MLLQKDADTEYKLAHLTSLVSITTKARLRVDT